MAKKSMKERLAAARASLARARHHGGKLLSGTKPMLLAGGAGALGQELTDFAAKHSAWVRDNWYGNAAVLAAAVLAARKKSTTAAHGLAGAAGYALNYDRKVANVAKGKTAPADGPSRPFAIPGGGGAVASNTTGVDDDAGMLIEPLPAH